MTIDLPSRAEVASMIAALRTGQRSRKDASAWALAIINDKDIKVTNAVVWRVLKSLGGADLSTEQGYLYGDQDFSEWAKELLS